MSFWRHLFALPRNRDRFPSHQVIKLIHQGRKTTVYQAHNAKSDEPRAIKVYNRQYNYDAAALRREYNLPTEGEIGKLMNAPSGHDPKTHPIVATYEEGHEFGNNRGAYYIILEYINGHNMKNLISTHHEVVREHARDILLQCCDALGYIHSRGFIHRDFCSDNVMIVSGCRAKVIDLGFASPIGRAFKRHSGTLTYMAPEQFTDAPLTAAVDIYGMGVVAYELVTGRPPFLTEFQADDANAAEKRTAALRHMHQNEPPPAPELFAPEISAPMREFVLRCLAKRPAARYRDMTAARAALEKVAINQ